MIRTIHSRLYGRSAAAALAAALLLVGCNPSQPSADDQSQAAVLPDLPATLPLVPGEAAPIAYAPGAEGLPAVDPIQAVRVADPGEYYAYADDAYGYADAIGEAPPDYGFAYDDVQPWGWQGYDDSLAFAEPLEDGYRYYYYRPGEDDPYFVRDPYYGYGYDDGRLAIVYDSYGGIVPYDDYGPRLLYASRYYYRGRDMYRASRHRRPVIAGSWNARRHDIFQSQSRWRQARERQLEWQAYHERNAARQSRYWEQERARRRADRVRFATWREQDFRTPPPPRAIPAAWTSERWARDERRFAPPARGFNGNEADRRRAVAEERTRLAQLARRAQAERRNAAQDRAEQRREALADRRQQRQTERAESARQRQDQIRAGNPRANEARVQAEARRAERQAQKAQRQERATERRQARPTEAARQQQAARQADRRQQAEARQQAQRQQRETARRQQVDARQQREAARQQQDRAEAARREREQVQAELRQQAAERQAVRQTERANAARAQARQQDQARERAERQASQAREREQAQARRQQARAETEQRRAAQAEQQQQRSAAQQARQRQQAQSEQRAAQSQAREQARASREQAQAARAAERAARTEERRERRERPR
ncbi:hypothetical protein [Sphingosinicella rhizophila]|uniref:Uncharacterized protein n=1 Tax=Sphingosinicella rhizophila TaxID=3050082 RepID=A0ABU3QAZ6_9SPHN|nr:hypothetical protein [Sphingosinicella sp. GR2756]MDT9600575.1 hypothetical protein [Sphingosinicella sp. GR2756]